LPTTALTYPLLAALSAVLLPFAGFLLSAALGKRAGNGAVATSAILLSLLAACYAFAQIWNQPPIHIQWHWFTIGEQAFHVGVLLDNMAVMMLVLVSLIALPVHIYSAAYMKGDPGIHRYWTYLSLFCFAMLGLVVADNLLLMYICWELVGFASYLLIGFWFTKDAAVQANKKAFIVNRIGDIGFLIGMALTYSHLGTLDTKALIEAPETLPAPWLTVAGLAFFLGAMAKSAQFPLHVWLPDAMEGPTSVSSLIHAATMVAAGVFLLARIFPVFDATVLLVIATIGTVTAFAAAYFALTQYDIKNILAFSTISQLGFMMVGIGIGMYPVALFHLATHAFFKCLLFLCAGAIIHEMQHAKETYGLDMDPQDIRNMGGLRKHMPLTFTAMLIASLALAGFPFTGGYLSKDALIVHTFEWAALQSGAAKLIPYVLVAVSMLTSFYILRLLAKVFFGSLSIRSVKKDIRIHEAPMRMLGPMLFLAGCSLFPLFSVNPLNDSYVWLMQGLTSPVSTLPPLRLLHLAIPVLTTGVTCIVAGVAWQWYVNGKYPLKGGGKFYRLSEHQGYLDALYDAAVVRPVVRLSQLLLWVDHYIIDGMVNGLSALGRSFAAVAAWVDQRLVDGIVRLIGKIAWGLGNVFRRLQNGRLQHYFATLFFIILVILLYHIVVLL